MAASTVGLQYHYYSKVEPPGDDMASTETKRKYIVFVDEIPADSPQTDNATPTYQITLSPHASDSGAMWYTRYLTKEDLDSALRLYLKYTPASIENYFSISDRHQGLISSLSDADAAHLGWSFPR
jgi:hypothetical protein